MLSKYTRDRQEPVCRPEDCQDCIRSCKEVYQEACRLYEQEPELDEQDLQHLRSMRLDKRAFSMVE